jgi:hypothetical protein
MTPRCYCSTDLWLQFLQQALLLQPYQRVPLLQHQKMKWMPAAVRQLQMRLQEQLVPRRQLLVWFTCRA